MLIDKDGKNIFYDESKLLMLADILEHVRSYTAITNPIVYSYKCLVGDEAPCYISWSDEKRRTLVRITVARGNATRRELRSRNSIVNLYLAFASILLVELDAIKNNKKEQSNNLNLYQLGKKERENLENALKEALGVEFINKFLKILKKEWNELD